MARYETDADEMFTASVNVEDIADELKILVPLLKAGVLAKREAYGKLYKLRRDLGRVVGTLGAGVPTQARTDQPSAAEGKTS